LDVVKEMDTCRRNNRPVENQGGSREENLVGSLGESPVGNLVVPVVLVESPGDGREENLRGNRAARRMELDRKRVQTRPAPS
jgi:hypothetical protein